MGARARARLRRSPARGRSRRWQAAAALITALLVIAGVPGAAAEPGGTTATIAASDPGTNADGCNNTTGLPYATGLPPLRCLKNPFTGGTLFQDQGSTFGPISQTAIRPKVSFDFPDTVLRVFYILCSTTFPATYPACPYDANFPAKDLTVTTGYYGIFADAYVQSPEGAAPQYGAFAKTKVTTMAFGSIPVTADVTVRQKYDASGTVVPFTLAWFQSQNQVNPGKYVPGYETYGPSPGSGYFFAPPALVTGPVDIEVSNVAVDKVPLDVGSTCHTSTTLGLTSPGGFYESGKPVKGQPGSYQPLLNGKSFLAGTVDIPAFSGCVANGQDVSALLTGTISGPGNLVDVTQQTALKPFGCIAKQKDGCDTKHPPTTYGS